MSEPVLKGWITPCELEGDVSDWRRELESLGVDVGTWDLFQSEFQECRVSLDTLKKLDPLWGRYIWGLHEQP